MIDEIRFAGNHGRWIKKRMFSSKKEIRVDDTRVVCCSYCETLFKSKWAESEYCPICGAIMDETGVMISEEIDDNNLDTYCCSLCGGRFHSYYDNGNWTECPDCGASLKIR